MRSTMFRTLGVAAVCALLGLPAVWADTYEGQVVQVQERVRTENGAEQHQILVRTRAGEQLRFELGAAGTCDGCVQVGDQVRVRTQSRSEASPAAPGPGGEPAQVARQLAVGRTDSIYTFRNRGGEAIPPRVRSGASRAPGGTPGGAGDLDRLRSRDRLCDPGTGGGTGAGHRHGGGQG